MLPSYKDKLIDDGVLCPACHQPQRFDQGVDVISMSSRLSKVDLNIVFGLGIGIISDKLISALTPAICNECLLLGKLFGADGRRIDGFSTFISSLQILARGRRAASGRTCQACNRQLYYAAEYTTLTSEPTGPGGVWMANGCCLLMRSDKTILLENCELRGVAKSGLVVDVSFDDGVSFL